MNDRKLSPEEFNRVKELAEEVGYARTKADGKLAKQKLNFFISGLSGQVFGNINGVLSKVAGYAASGRVEHKAMYINAMESELFVLESMVDNEEY